MTESVWSGIFTVIFILLLIGISIGVSGVHDRGSNIANNTCYEIFRNNYSVVSYSINYPNSNDYCNAVCICRLIDAEYNEVIKKVSCRMCEE